MQVTGLHRVLGLFGKLCFEQAQGFAIGVHNRRDLVFQEEGFLHLPGHSRPGHKACRQVVHNNMQHPLGDTGTAG